MGVGVHSLSWNVPSSKSILTAEAALLFWNLNLVHMGDLGAPCPVG